MPASCAARRFPERMMLPYLWRNPLLARTALDEHVHGPTTWDWLSILLNNCRSEHAWLFSHSFLNVAMAKKRKNATQGKPGLYAMRSRSAMCCCCGSCFAAQQTKLLTALLRPRLPEPFLQHSYSFDFSTSSHAWRAGRPVPRETQAARL